MQFAEITPTEFQKYAAESPYKSFMQTCKIAKLRERDGWTAHYLAVKSDKKILAATLLVSKPTFLGKATFYAPGGPLLDFADAKLTRFFCDKLHNFVKTHGGYVLHIDPYYELIERDREGAVVAGGFDRRKALENLKRCGFIEITGSSQPKYLFVLDIDGRTPEQIFADFKQNTRNLVHRAERNGVRVCELARDDLDIFKTVTAATSQRRHFTDRPLTYYQQMYDLFAPQGQVKFLVAEAEIDGVTKPLSVAMFMLYGDEITYLYSGSLEEYMREYNAQYLIQWHMIKYAAEHHFARYNFYGIRELPTPDKPADGIYRFKKGFGGKVVELIGTFELPVDGLVYRLHRMLAAVKSKLVR